jgi:hypothetical protein
MLPKMKPKRFEREVRRACHLSAWIKVVARIANAKFRTSQRTARKSSLHYPRQSRTALNWLFSKAIKIEFARSFGDAPRCWALSSSFE